MKKNIVEKLLEDDSYKEIKISMLSKYVRNKKLRSSVNKNIKELVEYSEDLDIASELLKSLIKYEDSVKVIKENLKEILSSIPCGWGLINDLTKNEELKEEILKEFPFFIELISNYKNGNYNVHYISNLLEDFCRLDGGKEKVIENLLDIFQNPKIKITEKSRILIQMKNVENFEDFIVKNFNELLKLESFEVIDLIDCFKYNSDKINIIFDSIEELEKKTLRKEDFLFLILKKFNFNTKENQKYQPTLRKLYKKVLEDKNSIIKIPLILEKFKEIDGLKDIYDQNKYVMENFYETIPKGENSKNIYRDEKLYNATIGIIIKEKQEYKLKAIVKELQGKNKEEKPQYCSNGAFSINYNINGRRLKIGHSKQIYNIPYHPKIMYPIFRKNYFFDDINKNLYIEVYEEGENDKEKITEQELVETYLELRKSGYFWSDAHKRNLVRLKKDNKIPDYVIKNNHKMFGFNVKNGKKEEHKELKKGEVVVCDLDSIYEVVNANDIKAKKRNEYRYDNNSIIQFLEDYGEQCILEAEINFQEQEKIKNNKENENIQENELNENGKEDDDGR